MSSSSCRASGPGASRVTRPGRLVRSGRKRAGIGLISAFSLIALALPAGALASVQATVDLGNASSFAVLGGSAVTNSGQTQVFGDLGVFAGTSVTGFGPVPTDGTVHGAKHIDDSVAGKAQNALTAAIVDASGRPVDQTPPSGEVGNSTLLPGVYNSGSALDLTGTLTLDAQNNPDAVFIFQAGTALNTAVSSNVLLINGAQACNVYWQIGSSATLGGTSHFVGNILAGASITMGNQVTLDGRALASVGDVTMLDDVVRLATCATPVVPPPDVTPPVVTPPVTTPPVVTPPVTTPPVTTPPTTTPPTTTPPVTPVTTPPTTGGKPGTPVGSQNTTGNAAAKAKAKAKAERLAKAKAKRLAKAKAKRLAKAKAKRLAEAQARRRAHHATPRPPTSSRFFTG